MKELYKISEAAKILGVSAKTLRTWDANGNFHPDLKDKKGRFYSRKQLEEKLGKSIEETIDPILALDGEDYERLLKNDSFTISNSGHNKLEDMANEIYKSLYEISGDMYSTNGRTPNCLIASTGNVAIFYSLPIIKDVPLYTNFDETGEKIGILNNFLNLYSTAYLPVNKALLVYKENDVEECVVIDLSEFVKRNTKEFEVCKKFRFTVDFVGQEKSLQKAIYYFKYNLIDKIINLKVNDTPSFDELCFDRKFDLELINYDGQGNEIRKRIFKNCRVVAHHNEYDYSLSEDACHEFKIKFDKIK